MMFSYTVQFSMSTRHFWLPVSLSTFRISGGTLVYHVRDLFVKYFFRLLNVSISLILTIPFKVLPDSGFLVYHGHLIYVKGFSPFHLSKPFSGCCNRNFIIITQGCYVVNTKTLYLALVFLSTLLYNSVETNYFNDFAIVNLLSTIYPPNILYLIRKGSSFIRDVPFFYLSKSISLLAVDPKEQIHSHGCSNPIPIKTKGLSPVGYRIQSS